MNVKRFTVRSSRHALHLVHQAYGDEAIVLSARAGSLPGERIATQLDGCARRFMGAALRDRVALEPECDDTVTRIRLVRLVAAHPDVNPLPPDCPGPAMHAGRGLAAA